MWFLLSSFFCLLLQWGSSPADCLSIWLRLLDQVIDILFLDCRFIILKILFIHSYTLSTWFSCIETDKIPQTEMFFENSCYDKLTNFLTNSIVTSFFPPALFLPKPILLFTSFFNPLLGILTCYARFTHCSGQLISSLLLQVIVYSFLSFIHLLYYITFFHFNSHMYYFSATRWCHQCHRGSLNFYCLLVIIVYLSSFFFQLLI